MLPEFLQYILFIGFVGLMLLLRLDARRFSAAEWDTHDGEWRVWLSRLSWYGAGLALALLIFALHPSPVSDLNLVLAPDRADQVVCVDERCPRRAVALQDYSPLGRMRDLRDSRFRMVRNARRKSSPFPK